MACSCDGSCFDLQFDRKGPIDPVCWSEVTIIASHWHQDMESNEDDCIPRELPTSETAALARVNRARTLSRALLLQRYISEVDERIAKCESELRTLVRKSSSAKKRRALETAASLEKPRKEVVAPAAVLGCSSAYVTHAVELLGQGDSLPVPLPQLDHADAEQEEDPPLQPSQELQPVDDTGHGQSDAIYPSIQVVDLPSSSALVQDLEDLAEDCGEQEMATPLLCLWPTMLVPIQPLPPCCEDVLDLPTAVVQGSASAVPSQEAGGHGSPVPDSSSCMSPDAQLAQTAWTAMQFVYHFRNNRLRRHRQCV